MRAVMATVARNVLNFRHDTPLSASQKQQIAAILSNHKEEIRAQAGRSRDARRAMLEAVDQAGPASTAATAAADKIGGAARERALLAARIGSEIKPLLTPEQLSRVRVALQEVEAAVDSALAK
jgi:Spy/CpxP family protein refolding chaperone